MMRVGVIGLGWGRMHVAAFRAAGAEVVALCGLDAGRARAVALAEGIALATSDVDALCAACDLVVVASPPEVHAAHVEAAWRHEKAVLCEKPLTVDAAEATRLAAASAAAPPSAVNFPYRMLPTLGALRRWLEGRAPREIVVTIRNGTVSSDAPPAGREGDFGGASHVIDAALWLARAGEPRWVEAALTPRRSAYLHLGLADAVVAIAHVAAPEPGIHGAWSLIGDGWEVGFAAGYVPARGGWCLSAVRAFERGAWSTLADAVEPGHGLEPWAQAHVDGAREMLALVGGVAPTRLASLADAARVQRVVAAALASERAGRRVELTPGGSEVDYVLAV
ncbi:MAG: Gfo/Idh/MocA family oxidoreductase [Myxococcota bacterium]